MDDQVIGVLGGGQLGRMMSQAASRLHIPLLTLSPLPAPLTHISNPAHSHPHFSPPLNHASGSFTDPQAIREFAKTVDVLTVEIEHVDCKVLVEVRDDPTSGRLGKGVKVWPSPEVVGLIQDKYLQKEHLQKQGVPVVDFRAILGDESASSLEAAVKDAGEALGWPLMLKSRLLAYDGRGNYLCKSQDNISDAIKALTPPNGAPSLYAERMAPFVAECAVMIVRSAPTAEGETEERTFPPVETVHENAICRVVYAPLRKGDRFTPAKVEAVGRKAIQALGDGAVGVFAVEMFIMPNGEVLVNEIAPRPHNSYHHTLLSTPISQFTAHILAILALPLPPSRSFQISSPAACMLNILGHSSEPSAGDEMKAFLKRAVGVEGSQVEWYGKEGVTKGRKLGHVNLVASSDAVLRRNLCHLLSLFPNAPAPRGSLKQGGFSHPHPLISIIMGSDSDLPSLQPAAALLGSDQFNVPFELEVVSAHRTPELMVSFAQNAASRGVRVIIAAAGGAAHLPGMVASLTTLPVIGVPIKSAALNGVDSLHSIVQMPKGVPVATVGIGNGANAALLAVRMLGGEWEAKVAAWNKKMGEEVEGKRERMREKGWEEWVVGQS